MKIRKILLPMLTVIATGAIAATTVTSCGISKDILNNLVDRGDGSKFSDNVTFEQAIKTALTNKSATDAFKKSVVDKIFFNWFRTLSGGNIDTLKKQYQKDIDADWKNQIQSYKDNHSTNWPYYFQNEVLNPVGGVKGKTDGTSDNSWYQSKWEEKTRSYFTGEMIKYNYLSVPLPEWDGLEHVNPTWNFPTTDLDLDVAYNISTSGQILGTGPFKDHKGELLNPDWWPAINFYARANPSYTPDNSTYQDKSYALLQREAFTSYTNTTGPVSTGMVLWLYSKGSKPDLKSIYNEEVITGKDGDTGLLDSPSYSFPYFGSNHTPGQPSPNEKFSSFVEAFADDNYFLDNRGDVAGNAAYDFTSSTVDVGSIGLIDIPVHSYGDDEGDLTIVNQSTGITDLFETYAGPLMDLYHEKNGVVKVTDGTPIMPDNTGAAALFSSADDILNNFLYAPVSGGTEPVLLKRLPYDPTDNGVVSLADTYGTNADGHVDLFNKDSDFYKDNGTYMVNAIRLGTTGASGVELPYIMVRNDKGVHVMGIDGAGYLAQDNYTPADATNSGWRPGAPWSQERENQILKYRTIYENNTTSPLYGSNIALIKQEGSTASGKLVDYLKSNIDSIILSSVDTVLDDTNPNYDSTYKAANMFGLKDFVVGDTNADWNTNLNALVQSFDLLNQFQTMITNYDANNKHLLAWSDKYTANSLYNPATSDFWVKYNNGLAMKLPLEVISGVAPAADGVFHENAKTYFKAASGCNTEIGDLSLGSGWSTKTFSSYVSDIIDNYQTWASSLSTNSQPMREGKGNLGGEYNNGKYSENILSFNPYVNALLNAFGSSSAFSNSEKVAALSKYISDASVLLESYSDPISSLFITQQLLNSTSISSLLNTNAAGTALPTFSNYKDALQSQWQYQLQMTIGSSAIRDGSSVLMSNGYTDQLINYDTLLASIKWLSGDGDYANFMKVMREKIVTPNFSSNSWQNAYIIWLTKDSEEGNHDYKVGDWDTTTFVDDDTNAAKWYGWKNNYDNTFSQEYSQTSGNVTGDIDTSYQSFAEYNQFAPMPTQTTQTGDAHSFNAMGYLGLQTSSGTINAIVKDALESNFPSSCSQDPDNNLRGSLYNFAFVDQTTGLTDVAKSREQMCTNIVDRLANDSNGLVNFAKYLNTRTAKFDSVIQQMDNADNNGDRKTILENAINDDTLVKDIYFSGYNVAQAGATYTSTPTLELRNPSPNNNTPVIKEDKASDDPAGYRARVMQLNASNLKSLDTLQLAVGEDLFKYLVVQVALDGQTTGTTVNKGTIDAVLANAYGDGAKAKVYDRRFNDQLGYSWVKDWKQKN